MKLERRHTTPGQNPLDQVEYVKRTSIITNPDGSEVFRMDDAEVPAGWSQLATDIVVSKYFRKRGVPKTGHETSARQVVHRVARTLRLAGEEQGGYFDTREDADTFEAELAHHLIHQMGAFNSPVWFNCGLYHEYGIKGTGGQWYWDRKRDRVLETKDAYSHPQCSACYIQSVDDDLMSIFDLLKNEARLFKYGAGTGTNFSKIRGNMEKLSGGGTSSGLMSFLEVFDKGAGATKSGGTTRRAAKMVCLDMDHPEIEDFINWKAAEEKKVAALIAGGYSSDFNGEAYKTVSGQNSNNSVRIPDEFMEAYLDDGEWSTRLRTTGETYKTYKARDLMRQISRAAWACADPGVQYDTTINTWHTCAGTDRINGSNPCVTGDTLIWTADGPQRIDSLVGQNPHVTGLDGCLHPATRVIPTGVKPVYRLRTRSGYEIKLTADHRVWTVNRGDVPAAELTRDDLVQLLPMPFGPETLDARVAEYVGLMLGDGCVSGGIATLTMNREVELSVATGAAEVVNRFERHRSAVSPTWRETRVCVATGAASVREMLAVYAVLDGGASAKQLTGKALRLDRSSTAALLRGLFTADGTVADYGGKSQYVGLDLTSETLLRQVQQLLLGFGIKSKLYCNRRLIDRALLPDGRGGLKEYPVQQMHSLRISRSSRVLFEREIGFLPKSEKARALAALNSRVSTYQDRLVDPVASLEPLGTELVYDLTEPITSHFVANGIAVHNCSEYMFLDDSACNLASINLMKFLREDGAFDIEGFRYACKLFFMAQEILVDFASYPTQKIAQNSHDYRPLGLGYANLGTLLMVLGLPYDSPEARAVCSAITAIMCGYAYATSARMAADKGAFPGFDRNRKPMLKVMNMHRDAAYEIDAGACPANLIEAAREDWDLAVQLGERHGYRNAQATVIAPTGTIGLLMDCDTTGIEPDFALVKFKKLAGGGYFKIVNQAVPQALRRLGYTDTQIQETVAYICGTLTLRGAPHIHAESLKEKGLTDADLQKVERALAGVFELPFAFTPWVLGEEAMQRLGIPPEQYGKPGFNLLRALGFGQPQIDGANDVICGRMTIEGAPHVKEEHLPVFDCANRCGKYGKRFIAPGAHLTMMAAAQKFISGAISKTVNVPAETTAEEIEKLYLEGWKLGLKAVAIYRDGSKLSQPLSTSSKERGDAETGAEAEKPEAALPKQAPAARAEGAAAARTGRRRLPLKRAGFTQEARVAGHKVFLRTGEYDDGTLGEIFIDMHKEGAPFRSMLNCFAIAVSKGLQYGVPLEEFVDTFTFIRFEPWGTVDHPNIKFATSVIDYIFRVLGYEYLGRTDFLQVKPEDRASDIDEHEAIESAQAPPAPEAGGSSVTAGTKSAAPTARSRGTNAAGAKLPPTNGSAPAERPQPQQAQAMVLDEQLSHLMGDAPFCDTCGHITVRNGSCYRCLNCGNSVGCS